jgi:hypothetical protein
VRIGAGLDARFPPVRYEASGNQPPAELKSRLAGAVIATTQAGFVRLEREGAA